MGFAALYPSYDCSASIPHPHPHQQRQPTTKNTTSTAMPAFWLAVTAVIAPIRSGPMNDVTLPVSANSPKYCAMRSCGARRISSVREAACSGPPAAPIRQPRMR